MSEDKPPEADIDDDPTICFCHCVPRSRLLAAIRAGAVTLAQIQEETRASTGCGGCECDVLELLEAELRQKEADLRKRAG